MAHTLWEVYGKSVVGAAHKRLDRTGQDAIRWIDHDEGGMAILAVADGHGSNKAFRSERGAQFAVDLATIIKDLLTNENLSVIKREANVRIPQEIVRQWTHKVQKDCGELPFTPEELETLESKDGEAAKQAVDENPLLVYGTTLIAVAVTESLALYIQLGDGDIVCVSDQGDATRPMPGDPRLFANETTSLCAPNAWSDFRVQFQVFLERRPALIMASTDGYANSFQNDEGFLRVGPDILKKIQEEGWDETKQSLEAWLTETSEKGSGDDISLGLIWRRDLADEGGS